jgi:hypothetical protein
MEQFHFADAIKGATAVTGQGVFISQLWGLEKNDAKNDIEPFAITTGAIAPSNHPSDARSVLRNHRHRCSVYLFPVHNVARPAILLDLAAAAADPPLASSATRKRRPGLTRPAPRLVVGPRHRRHFSAKRLGEIAEAMFLAKAADLGFTVLKPWGDSEAYDFVLDAHRGRGGFSRVQVKSAHRKGRDQGYSFSSHDFTMQPYRAHDIDAIVAYVVPEDAWYIIPIDVLRNTKALQLFPSRSRRGSKYEKYRDAWQYLVK